MATATDEVGSEKGVSKGKTQGALHCLVVTPETTTLDEAAEFVALPLIDGELGILPGRAPLIGRLGFGELRTRQAGATHRYFVDGGFVQVRDNVVTVLTGRAIPAERIDAQAAQAELDKARALPGSTAAAQAEKSRAVDRARGQLRVASATAHV